VKVSAKAFVVDFLAVDADALVDFSKVGRGISAPFESRRGEGWIRGTRQFEPLPLVPAMWTLG